MKNENDRYSALLDFLCNQRRDGSTAHFPVLSGSMLPLIKPGDMVEIKPAHWKNCHIGDIIVFKDRLKLITHRLLFKAIVGEFVIMFQKGDNNRFGTFIGKDQVVGKVILIRKKNEKIISLMNSKTREKARSTAYFLRAKTIFNLCKDVIKGVTGWKKTDNANVLYRSEKQR